MAGIGNKSPTDWKRVDALKDQDIDFSDIREIPPEMTAGDFDDGSIPFAVGRSKIAAECG
jgi:hypothetical protein